MLDNFEHCYLMIVGDASLYMRQTYMSRRSPWTLNHHLGLMSSLATRYDRLKIIQIPNDTQLVKIVPRICEKAYDGKVIDIGKTELMRDKFKDVKNIKIRMLLAIPRLGYKRALELFKHIDLLIVNKEGQPITEKELKKVNGIGKKTVATLLSINKKEPS